MEKERKQKLLGDRPRGKTVVFRKHKAVLVDSAIIRWRKANRKRRAKEAKLKTRLARYNNVFEEAMDTLGAEIINPFSVESDTE